ncbi:hypothetical protein Emed_004693 [Eimeria media]
MPKGVGAKLPPPMKAKAPSVVAGGDAESPAVLLSPKDLTVLSLSDALETRGEADSRMLEALQIIPAGSKGLGVVSAVPALPFASVEKLLRGRLNPSDVCFPETIADVELLFSRSEDVVTGSCFYNLGPKATVEASCGDKDVPLFNDNANRGTTNSAKALIALDRIKGLYDSPVSLLPWSQTQKSSASLSCTQISKLPPVQYTTALSVWSELILHQKSQVIAVVGCHSDGNDRIVPSLISSFGLLKGTKLKEQMHFAESISRLYDVLRLWSTVESRVNGPSTISQLRWIIGFSNKGDLQDLALSGALLGGGPTADEGCFKIVLQVVQSVLSDAETLRLLGVAELSQEQLSRSLLHGDITNVDCGLQSSEGLLSLMNNLQTTLGFSTSEAANAIRICLACWILSKGAALASEDLDAVETLLGSRKGAVLSILQGVPTEPQKAAIHLRNVLYDDIFNYVLKAANTSARLAFQPLVGSSGAVGAGKKLQIIIEDAPSSKFAEGPLAFSDCVCRIVEMTHLALAFRGLHNLQRVLRADGVALPSYLSSLTRLPQTQVLVQLFFSKVGGLIPFLSQRPRTIEDIWSWMAWMNSNPPLPSVLEMDSSSSLLINWLGNWSTVELAELVSASWTGDVRTSQMIDSLLRSVSPLVGRCPP